MGKRSATSKKLTSFLTGWMNLLRTKDVTTKHVQSMASNALSVLTLNNGKVLPIVDNNEFVMIGAPSGNNSEVQLVDEIRRPSLVN